MRMRCGRCHGTRARSVTRHASTRHNATCHKWARPVVSRTLTRYGHPLFFLLSGPIRALCISRQQPHRACNCHCYSVEAVFCSAHIQPPPRSLANRAFARRGTPHSCPPTATLLPPSPRTPAAPRCTFEQTSARCCSASASCCGTPESKKVAARNAISRMCEVSSGTGYVMT